MTSSALNSFSPAVANKMTAQAQQSAPSFCFVSARIDLACQKQTSCGCWQLVTCLCSTAVLLDSVVIKTALKKARR